MKEGTQYRKDIIRLNLRLKKYKKSPASRENELDSRKVNKSAEKIVDIEAM